MSQSERPADLLKRVTSATVKAIANRPELEVHFQASGASANEGSVNLPAPSGPPSAEGITKLRGVSDALALRLRFHDADLHRKLAPAGPDSHAVFEALEQARCESIGSQRMTGVADNLDFLLAEKCRAKGYGAITERDEAMLPEMLGLLVRERLPGQTLPAEATQVLDLWRDELNKKVGTQLGELEKNALDQEAYANLVREMIVALDMMTDAPAPSEPENQQDSAEDDPEQGSDDNQNADSDVDTDGSMSSESGEAEMSEDMEYSTEGFDEDVMSGEGEEEPAGPSDWDENWPRNSPDDLALYKAFTQAYDEVIEAEELCDSEELTRLRGQLDQQLSHLQGVVSRLANRLQRKLMAKQTRSWDFDLEEGLLDAARLSRVVTDPLHPLSFKQEQDTDFRDTTVALLIDNSGSMRGRPITVAAMSADILARTLERCGVKVEILGFTTRSWKGGQSREDWVEKGKPKNPGRLNDLRHIVYKAADLPWRRARKNLGLMLREGLLKENIDGEALMWAHNRLLARPEQRRILMVISDGAPVDDATLSANPGNYLEKHLRDVIEFIETKSDVELTAIGIGHDVTRYYRRAVTIVDAEELGGTMMANLAELFDEDTPSGGAGRARGRRAAG
ncbi:MAG: cobaltochelatase subunit CobT [Rhodospirillaceae bacterium]|nr:cobaltochelatase subunit CobT [Rhodospirillaceae bacterium]